MPAQPTPELLLVERRAGAQLARQVNICSNLLWKALPSATDSCSSLEPCHIFILINCKPSYSPVLLCWLPPIQASWNRGEKTCICREKLWEGLCLLKDPFLWCSCLLFPFRFLYTSGITLCLIYKTSKLLEPFANSVELDGASGRESLSILSCQAWENGRCPHICEKKDIFLRNPFVKSVTFL